jgi:transcriptional/translational regulatory protein YebC/TACO1
MQAALEEKKWLVSNSELQRIPVETTSLSLEDAQTVMKLIDKMEEDDDVNAVYHNLRNYRRVNKISIVYHLFFLSFHP